MEYKPRLLATRPQRMVERFAVVVVCGARQVWKSNLVGHALPGWDTVVFDPAQDSGKARQDPDLFLDNHPAPLVLVEIQYAPELVPAIKRRVAQCSSPDHWLARYLQDPEAFNAQPVTRLSLSGTTFQQLWLGCFADTGLACSLQRISIPEALAGHPMAGALYETAVVAESRELSAALSTPPGFRHWRSHGGAEVDLLLERDGRLNPVEIKLTTRPQNRHTRGFAALRQTHPQARIAPGPVICAAGRSWRLNEMDVAVPWDRR